MASRASEIIFAGTVVNIVGYGRGLERRFLRGRRGTKKAVLSCSTFSCCLQRRSGKMISLAPAWLIANSVCPCLLVPAVSQTVYLRCGSSALGALPRCVSVHSQLESSSAL
eukprot:COSAG01_NODE_46187_length_402_cov_0.943894_1_plen_110_part_01